MQSAWDQPLKTLGPALTQSPPPGPPPRLMQKRYEKDAVGYVPPPKPTKSGKRLAKDPERPKKAKTAYLFYADQARPSISKANPGLSVTVSLSQKLNKYTTNLAALSLSLARGEARSRAAYDELPVPRRGGHMPRCLGLAFPPPPPPSLSPSHSLPLSHSPTLTLSLCTVALDLHSRSRRCSLRAGRS